MDRKLSLKLIIAWLKQNQIVAGVLVIAIAVAFYTLSARNHNKISDTELLRLKKECAGMAEELANKRTENNTVSRLSWEVRHSDYNLERKSCFAEFYKDATFFNNPGQNFSEVLIEDLFKRQTIIAWTYYSGEGRKLDDKFEAEYTLTQSKEYEKTKKDIFGLGLYE